MNQKCKICGSDTREFLDKQFNVTYYHCGICEFISKDEATIVSPEDEKAEYDLHNNSYDDEGYLNMFRRFYDRSIKDFANGGHAALDFGSGPEPVLLDCYRKSMAIIRMFMICIIPP